MIGLEPDWASEERIPVHRMLTVADLFTLFNGFFGFCAIALAAMGYVQYGYMLVLLGVLADGIDGGLARLGYGAGRLGSKLDTLSDLVTFCVAPAFLVWTSLRGHALLPGMRGPAWLATDLAATALLFGACVLYFLTGLIRLARFDYLKGGERHDYFIGVSTPGGAVVLASLALLSWDLLPSLFLVVVTSFLMTSRVRLPKVRGALTIPAVLVISTALLLGSYPRSFGPVILLVCFLFYLMIGPGYVRRHMEADESSVPF